jgi:hypothetical protein
MNHIPVTPMVYVLDACSQIAFLRREPGADVIDGLLSDIGNECFTHAVNHRLLCIGFVNTHRRNAGYFRSSRI